MSIEELVKHIWGLVNWICLSVESKRFRKQKDILQTRKSTLEMILELRRILSDMKDEELRNVIIDGSPFWHIINGPISDALSHVGQINSFRRLAGNPPPSANVYSLCSLPLTKGWVAIPL